MSIAKRAGRWAALSTLMALTKMAPLHRVLPPRVRERLFVGWTHEMYRKALFSGGTCIFSDIPCEMDPGKAHGRRCDVAGSNRISDEDLANFYRDGFLRPFQLVTPKEMREHRAAIVTAIRVGTSNVYEEGKGLTQIRGSRLPREVVQEAIATRDRHLDTPELWSLVAHEAVKQRLVQLLGPDVVVWRSQFFAKQPGFPRINWHVESCFMTDNASTPALRPKRLDELFQLTVWVALDDTDLDNGCLHFVPGSYMKMVPMRLLDKAPQVSRRFVPWWRQALTATAAHPDAHPFPIPREYYEQQRVVAVPMKAGECLIFSGRGVHGSPANETQDRPRTGINFRVLRADVEVINNDESRYFNALQTRFDTGRWGVVPLSGEPGTHNRVCEPPPQASTYAPT